MSCRRRRICCWYRDSCDWQLSISGLANILPTSLLGEGRLPSPGQSQTPPYHVETWRSFALVENSKNFSACATTSTFSFVPRDARYRYCYSRPCQDDCSSYWSIDYESSSFALTDSEAVSTDVVERSCQGLKLYEQPQLRDSNDSSRYQHSSQIIEKTIQSSNWLVGLVVSTCLLEFSRRRKTEGVA